MGTLIITLGNFNVMYRGITSNGYGSSSYPWGISSSTYTVEYCSKYSRGTVTDMYVQQVSQLTKV